MAAASTPSPDALLQHAAFVRTVARAALRGDDLVDDVVQETWVAALEGGATRAKRLRPWLGGVARRQAANLLRRRIVARERDRRTAPPEPLPPPSEVAERVETGRRLVRAVLALEEPYRTAVLLRYYDDLPPREVAERTGVPVETARTRVRRGVQRLRRELDEDASRRGRSAPALLLSLVDLSGPSVAVAALSFLGGLLAVKKLAVGIGIVALVLLGAYAIQSGALERRSPPVAPPLDVAEEPAPPRLEGQVEAEGETPPPLADAPQAASAGREVTTFRGTVVDPDGGPIPGATIGIDRHPPWHTSQIGRPAVDPDTVAPVTSDVSGHFGLQVPGQVGWLFVRPLASGWVLTQDFGVGLSSTTEGRIVMVSACPLDVTVLDDATGRGIEGAEVHGVVGVNTRAYLVHPPWPTAIARTDRQGRARLPLPEGRVRLLVRAAGYATYQEDSVALRPEGEELTLRLRPGGTVRGLVVDPDGKPVAFANVHAYAPVAWQVDTQTDAEGVFVLENTTLPLGGEHEFVTRTHVVVVVTAEGWPRAWSAVRAPPSGQEAAIRVALEKGHRLEGRVRMADGTAVPEGSAALTVMDFGTRNHYASTPTMHGRVDASGRFAFEDLPVGEVELHLYRGTSRERKVEVDVGAHTDATPLDVVLGDGVELSVRVVDAVGDPVHGAHVHVLHEPGDSPLHVPGPQGLPTSTDAEGRVLLKDEAAVPFHVVVDAPGFGPEVRTFDPSVSPSSELEVRLGDGVVEGVVVHPDRRPAQAVLRLTRRVRFDRYASSFASTTTDVETDAEGRFLFQGVGEGTYGLQVGGVDLRSLSFGVRLHAGDTDARIVVATRHEATKLHVEALLLDAGTLEPVEGQLYVAIHPEGGRGSGMMQRVSEPKGVFRSTEPYAPGAHTVRVSGEGWETAEAVARLVWGAETPRPRILLTRAK